MRQISKDFLYAHIGKVIGLAIGIFVGIIYLLFGLFKTIIFLMLVTIGYLIGTKIDQNEDILSLIERFLPNHWR